MMNYTTAVAEVLIEYGASLNTVNANGWTAHQIADFKVMHANVAYTIAITRTGMHVCRSSLLYAAGSVCICMYMSTAD
jgi:hypothetical protein